MKSIRVEGHKSSLRDLSIGLPTVAIGAIRKEILTNVETNLPKMIDAYLSTGDLTREETLGYCFKLPKDALQLNPSWQLLARELDLNIDETTPDASEETETRYTRLFRAFTMTSMLLYQTALPANRRFKLDDPTVEQYIDDCFRGYRISEEGENQHRANLEQTLAAFKENLNSTFEVPIETPEEAKRQTLLYLGLVHAIYQKPFRNGLLTLMDPADIGWFRRVREEKSYTIMDNNFVAELLSEGKLEEIDEGTRFIIWIRSWVAEKSERYTDLAKYYFNKPEVQELFWGVLKINFRDSEYQIQHTVDNFLIEISILGWFFGQDEETLKAFLDSARDLSYDSRMEKANLLGRLIGVAGIFQTSFPDHPNTSLIRDGIKDLVQHAGMLEQLEQELAILCDARPGLIYQNINREARARLPSQNQTRGEFLSEQERKTGEQVLYVSQASWPEKESTAKKTGEQLLAIQGETQFLPLWGEVQIPQAGKIPSLLDSLNQRLAVNSKGLTQDSALDLLAKHQSSIIGTGRDSFILLPDILPPSHEMAALTDLGIIAVQQDKKNAVFVLDAQRAGLSADSPRIALLGELNRSNDLAIPGQNPDFELSILHLLLTSAALCIKAPPVDLALSKDEVSQIRSFVKAHNIRAKEKGLPKLTFDENANSNGNKCLYFVGRKPVLLGINTL